MSSPIGFTSKLLVLAVLTTFTLGAEAQPAAPETPTPAQSPATPPNVPAATAGSDSASGSNVVPPIGSTPPLIGLDEKGLYLGNRDLASLVRLRGVLQVDGRDYPNSGAVSSNDTFLVRRARLYIEGTVGHFVDYRLLPDFAGSQVQLLDAFVDVAPVRWLGLRVGKAKTAFGLERLQADQALHFIERGLPQNLVPDRDIGAALHGELGRGLLSYDVGVVNGAPGGANVDLDTGGAKDVVGRLFVRPFVPLRRAGLERIGLGFAVTDGRQQGTPTSTSLSPARSTGQITFFNYLVDSKGAATVVANGDRLRYAPQLNAYVGPFGLFGEYVHERVNVSKPGASARLDQQAWQVAASWVLTGERDGYEGVVPASAVGSGGLGAMELAARLEGIDLDPDTFPTFADPKVSARRARAAGAALNWYPNRFTKLSAQFERTLFKGGAARGDRQPENDLIGRVQIFF